MYVFTDISFRSASEQMSEWRELAITVKDRRIRIDTNGAWKLTRKLASSSSNCKVVNCQQCFLRKLVMIILSSTYNFILSASIIYYGYSVRLSQIYWTWCLTYEMLCVLYIVASSESMQLRKLDLIIAAANRQAQSWLVIQYPCVLFSHCDQLSGMPVLCTY